MFGLGVFGLVLLCVFGHMVGLSAKQMAQFMLLYLGLCIVAARFFAI
jgi:hypothetical protein